MLCVGGTDTPIDQHISNTQTKWQLSAGDEKSISALKINIYEIMGYDQLDSTLGSYSVLGIDISIHNPSKNAGCAEYSLGSTREYLIIYRGPGFLVVI